MGIASLNPYVDATPLQGTDTFISYVRLARTPGLGPKRLATCLAATAGDPRAAVDAFSQLSTVENLSFLQGLTLPTRTQIEEEIAAHERLNARLIGWYDPLYPEVLRGLADAPPLLSLRGQDIVWQQVLMDRPRTIGIVGARHASVSALRLAHLWSAEMAASGWCVVSGLARGVDTAAHLGALSAAGGTSIAVMACGIDVCYPPENQPLYEQLATDHVLLTEQPLGQGPLAQHFPRRNRLIAALARGLLVVEAGLRSGSLITARSALEQNRDIFVVSGFPLDPRYEGSNWLIQQGAHLVQNTAEITSHLDSAPVGTIARKPSCLSLPPSALSTPPLPETITSSLMDEVWALLSDTPIAVDLLLEALADRTTSLSDLMTALIHLELEGRVIRHVGGLWSRLP